MLHVIRSLFLTSCTSVSSVNSLQGSAFCSLVVVDGVTNCCYRVQDFHEPTHFFLILSNMLEV